VCVCVYIYVCIFANKGVVVVVVIIIVVVALHTRKKDINVRKKRWSLQILEKRNTHSKAHINEVGIHIGIAN
jgi:hypothetical protein